MGSKPIVTANERSNAVISWRKRTRRRLIDLHGGKCKRCGWHGHTAGFDFHHLYDKDSGISQMLSSPRSWALIVAEAEKCELLCAICHRLEHAGRDYDLLLDGPLEKEICRQICLDCNTQISCRGNRCGKCSRIATTKGAWPLTVEEILRDVKTLGWSATGRRYGVSDNAVRKRVKRLGGIV